MIRGAAPNRLWVIGLTFVIALMLTAMPLPQWASAWRPAWVAMVLVYLMRYLEFRLDWLHRLCPEYLPCHARRVNENPDARTLPTTPTPTAR